MNVMPMLALGLLFQASSPTVKPENPVIKNGGGNTKRDAAQNKEQSGHAPSIPGSTHTPSAPEADRTKADGGSNANDGTYSVKVLSQPNPKDTGAFLIYVGLTALAMIVNAAILFAIIRQNKINWRQMRINVRAARAARASANAARDSANFAEKTTRLTERADVLLDQVIIPRDDRGYVNVHSRVLLQFKNFGRTRAINVQFNCNLTVKDTTETAQNEPLPTVVIGAGDTQMVGFSAFGECLTQDATNQVFGGQKEMRFIGELTYEDVFKEKHRTRSEGVYDRRLKNFLVTHNEAD